jgi:hypothetical protein
LPFLAAIALCPLEAPRRSSCCEKNTPPPELINFLLEPNGGHSIRKKLSVALIGATQWAFGKCAVSSEEN